MSNLTDSRTQHDCPSNSQKNYIENFEFTVKIIMFPHLLLILIMLLYQRTYSYLCTISSVIFYLLSVAWFLDQTFLGCQNSLTG